MQNPKISVITVVKNNKKDIERNINSVLNQTYKNYEHIIIDGKSEDGTLEVIRKYQNKISYWISQKDDGLYDAMNKGLDLAKGDIIGILNSDDIYYENALEYVKQYFEKYEDIDFLYGTVIKYKKLSGYNPKKNILVFWFLHISFSWFFHKK